MRDDEPAELDFNLETLARFEAGVLEPTAGKLEPGHEGRVDAAVRLVGLPAAGFLGCDDTRVTRVKCFKIGVTHDRLLVRVDGDQRVVWVAAHAARAAFTAMEVLLAPCYVRCERPCSTVSRVRGVNHRPVGGGICSKVEWPCLQSQRRCLDS